MQIERVLVAEDEPLVRDFMVETLIRLGCDVTQAGNGTEACKIIADSPAFDMVLTDIHMEGADGLEVLTKAKEHSASTLVVLCTAHATLETAIEAMRLGAFDYLTKPVLPNRIEVLLTKAAEFRSLVEENRFYRRTAVRPEDGFEDLVGRSDAMKDVFRLVDKVAASSATILITGESGTGKELIARALHQRSPRATKPFIRVNCAALPETLLESELFGHERGAFTGALERRPGRFELAHTGTLLLDEISETSLALQSKLLRVLQEREFERVGGSKTVKVDVRVICTSNRDLAKHVKEGKFREDLFYRLNVVPVALPALRSRGGDVLLLADYFLRRYAERHRRPLPVMSQEVRGLLSGYEWPGNVRELENTIERAVLLNEGNILSASSIGIGIANVAKAPAAGLPETTVIAAPNAESTDDAVSSLADVERKVILKTLRQTNGNRTKASRLLGISVRTLYTKLREYQSSEHAQEIPEEAMA